MIELILNLMLTATLVTGASIGNNDRLDKRISAVELDTAVLSAKDHINPARIARYYRSPLLLDDKGEDSDDNEVIDIQDKPNLISESPAVSIEMPVESNDSEHPLLTSAHRKQFRSRDQLVSSTKETEARSYALPANYEYPELVQSLKNVYKEMFITSSLYVLNIISAVGIVLVNKFIYSHYKFPHGLVLTLYHFVLTSIGLQVLAGLKMFPIKPVSMVKILPLSISFCSYVVLTNLSLQYNSGTFYQVQSQFLKSELSFLDVGGTDHRLASVFTLRY